MLAGWVLSRYVSPRAPYMDIDDYVTLVLVVLEGIVSITSGIIDTVRMWKYNRV